MFPYISLYTIKTQCGKEHKVLIEYNSVDEALQDALEQNDFARRPTQKWLDEDFPGQLLASIEEDDIENYGSGPYSLIDLTTKKTTKRKAEQQKEEEEEEPQKKQKPITLPIDS